MNFEPQNFFIGVLDFFSIPAAGSASRVSQQGLGGEAVAGSAKLQAG